MTARRQAALYYARKRRRSLRGRPPRLFRTHEVSPGAVLADALPADMLDRPVTFHLTADLATTGQLFSLGSNVVADRPSASNITFAVRGRQVADLSTPAQGRWTLVFAVRPGDRETRVWNQFSGEVPLSRLDTDPLPAGRYAEPTDDLTAGAALVSPLSVFTAQLPRHFTGEGLAVAADTRLLLDATALNFVTGWPWPLFEEGTP